MIEVHEIFVQQQNSPTVFFLGLAASLHLTYPAGASLYRQPAHAISLYLLPSSGHHSTPFLSIGRWYPPVFCPPQVVTQRLSCPLGDGILPSSALLKLSLNAFPVHWAMVSSRLLPSSNCHSTPFLSIGRWYPPVFYPPQVVTQRLSCPIGEGILPSSALLRLSLNAFPVHWTMLSSRLLPSSGCHSTPFLSI